MGQTGRAATQDCHAHDVHVADFDCGDHSVDHSGWMAAGADVGTNVAGSPATGDAAVDLEHGNTGHWTGADIAGDLWHSGADADNFGLSHSRVDGGISGLHP